MPEGTCCLYLLLLWFCLPGFVLDAYSIFTACVSVNTGIYYSSRWKRRQGVSISFAKSFNDQNSAIHYWIYHFILLSDERYIFAINALLTHYLNFYVVSTTNLASSVRMHWWTSRWRRRKTMIWNSCLTVGCHSSDWFASSTSRIFHGISNEEDQNIRDGIFLKQCALFAFHRWRDGFCL